MQARRCEQASLQDLPFSVNPPYRGIATPIKGVFLLRGEVFHKFFPEGVHFFLHVI